MKYIVLIVVSVVVFVIVALSMYLSPDALRQCDAPQESGPCAVADAIVVVSGGDTNARVDEGLALYKAGWASKLIFSGAAADPSSPSNAASMSRRALAAGVPTSSIIIEEFSRTTAENAENTSKFIADQQLDHIILVTSAYHQRRALLEFQQTLGNGVLITSHPVAADKQWAGIWWWTTLRGWWLAGGELVKIGVFYASPDGGVL